ncbi:coagulation factor XI-like [Fundulus diaphanus]
MGSFSVLVGLLLASSFSFSKACTEELLENIDFPGTDIIFLFSPSATHCQYLCTQHPSCLFFTFIRPDWTIDDRHFHCFLKSTPSGQPNSQVPLQGVTSGFSLKSCNPDPRPDFAEVFENVDFAGADYGALFTPDHEECQRVCTEDPGCQFFTFLEKEFPEQKFRYKCHLKFSWSIPRAPIVERTAGVTSGFSHTSPPPKQTGISCQEQLFPNTDFPGNDFEQPKAVSPQHCQSLCSAHPKCTSFSFFSSDFRCFLKNNPNELTAQPKDGLTSGLPARLCDLDQIWARELYVGVDFRGSDIRFELTDDAELCQMKCVEDPNCQFFTYVDETFADRASRRRCFLKRGITMPAPPRVNKLNNVVSGFRLRK